MRTRHIILFALLLALSFLMLTACKNDPAARPDEGSVLCYLNGVVYDAEASKPIAGATVAVAGQTVTTDQSGSFVVKNVAAGTYSVSVNAEGYTSWFCDYVVVDSGRFAPKDLKLDDLEADEIATLIELAEPDGDDPIYEIKTIGEANVYGQSIFAIGLYPEVVPSGILTGSIFAKFDADDGRVLPVSYTEISAVKVDQEGDPIFPLESYRTIVEIDGSFIFTGLEDGLYVLVVDPFIIEYAGLSVDFDARPFVDNIVLVNDGRGEAGNIYYETDEEVDFSLQIVSITAVTRSEIPDEATRLADPDAFMQAGGGLLIEFNKPIDAEADGTFFEFSVYSQFGEIVGYTNHFIYNVDNKGYALVWHDGIEYILENLKLAFHVSSYTPGDDLLVYDLDIDYTYPLNIVATNLYEYDFYGVPVDDYTFGRELSLLFIFDRPIPENSIVVGELYNGGHDDKVDVDFAYEGEFLVATAALRYGSGYYLRFKIYTEDGVVIYNTAGGLERAEMANIVIGDESEISFKTVEDLNLMDTNLSFIEMGETIELKFDEQIWDFFGMVDLKEVGSEDDIKCLTYIKEDDLHDTLVIDPYIPLKPKTNYTLYISGIIQTDEFDADRTYMFDTASQEFINYNDDFNVVDLDAEGNIVFETAEPTFRALDGIFYETNINLIDETHGFDPYEPIIIEYSAPVASARAVVYWINEGTIAGDPVELVCTAEGNILTASLPDGQWLFPGYEYVFLVNAIGEDKTNDITTTELFIDGDPEFLDELSNGLGSFEILGEYDSVDELIALTWFTEGYHFGEEDVYQLWKRAAQGEWEYIASFDEFEDSIDAYYNPEFYEIAYGLEEGDLDFGGYCEYVLISYDANGFMIQSPVRKIEDTEAPVAKVYSLPLMPEGVYDVGSGPIEIFISSESHEYLLKDSVVITGQIPVKMELTPKVTYGVVTIEITFKGVVTYHKGDLDIFVSFADTSGNISEPIELKF